METPEQIAEQLVAEWQSRVGACPAEWDLKDFATEAIRRSIEQQRHQMTRTGCVADYDLSGVIHLTHNKTQHIIGSRGYAVTGFVLTDAAGRKCIVDMSAVRWFDEPQNFHKMMHPD